MPKRSQRGALFSDSVQSLMTLVEESTRSTKEGVRYFVPPGEGVLERAKSRRHHIFFGRRGSGKSSLLAKVFADQIVARAPCALVDLEEFKGHTYPDVLVSVLIKTFAEFQKWVDTAATAPSTKTSFWSAFSLKKPAASKLPKAQATELSARIAAEIAALEAILHSPEAATLEDTAKQEQSEAAKAEGSARVGVHGMGLTRGGVLQRGWIRIATS